MRSFSVLAAACCFGSFSRSGASAALAQGRPIVNLLSNRCIDVPRQPGTTARRARSSIVGRCRPVGAARTARYRSTRWEWVIRGFILLVLSGLCLDVQGEPGTRQTAAV